MDKDRIVQVLDKMDDRLDKIEIHQVEIKQDLKHHVKRTDDLQEIVVKVKTHVDAVSGILKATGVLATVVGLLAGIISITKGLI